MAQHDYVIANGTGSAVRSDLNDALAAIVSMNSGSTEPSTTFAFQFWADTNANLLKMRNSANDGWIELRQLDGEFTSVSVANGTAAAPSIFFNASGTDTGIYSNGTDSVDVSTGGTRRLDIGSAGDVTVRGGNVTLNAQGDLRLADSDSSNWVAFQAPATVASNVTWTLPSTDGTNGDALTTNGSGTLSWTSAGGASITQGNTSAEVVDTGSDGHFKVVTEGTEALRVNSSQNVGIGTTSPSAQLVVSNGGAGGFEVSPGDSFTTLYSYNRSTSSYIAQRYDGSAHIFQLGGAGNEKARIDSSGRLLVGTSTALQVSRVDAGVRTVTPYNLLAGTPISTNTGPMTHAVVGYYDGFFATIGPSIVMAKSNSATVGTHAAVGGGTLLGALDYQGSDGTNFISAAQIRAEVDATPGTNDMPGRLVFSTTADGASSPTEAMRITNKQHLYVHNNVQYSGSYTNMIYTGNDNVTLGVRFDTNTSGKQYGIEVNNIAGGTNSYAIIFGNGSTAVGSIAMQTSSTQYNTTSDYRLKENIVPLTGAIERVNQLQVRRFNFIIEPDNTVDGFIAHEVKDIVPEAVSGEKDGVKDDGSIDPQGIDQSKLVPLLTAALQEAIGKIEALETANASLDARLTALENA